MNNRLRLIGHIFLYCVAGAAFAASEPAARTDIREWAFRVYLDDREIGNHSFTVTDFGDDREIRTEAELDVKFLFFNAYSYRHRNTERWDGECLTAIESETNANGDRYSLTGTAKGDTFVLSKTLDEDRAEVALPDCVTTFAYWDPSFLQQSRLLNTQTGDYVDIETELVGEDLLTVRGDRVPTYRYRLKGEDLDIELWYSMDFEWLALESRTDGGRRLRYELI